MLTVLSIRNIVLIDSLDLVFQRGMSVLSGETGVGKSILLDSLSLALGGRGDGTLVRTNCNQGRVTAIFELVANHPVSGILKCHDIPVSETLVLRRIQNSDGRTKAYVNDEPVSAGFMREVGQLLVEIHGQHDDRALLDVGEHRRLLDAFGGLEREANNVLEAGQALNHGRSRLAKLRKEIENSTRNADYLRESVEELHKLSPESGEETDLVDRRQRMLKAEKILEEVRSSHKMMTGQASPISQIAGTIRRLEHKSTEAPGLLEGTIEKLDSALVHLYDVQEELEGLLDAREYDPNELENTQERLFALRAASRKYAVPVEILPDLAIKMGDELAAISSSEKHIGELESSVNALHDAYLRLCTILSKKRHEASKDLISAVMSEFPALKLEQAEFFVCIDHDVERISISGHDDVVFEIRTNPGTRKGPITKVASGGELSRILLALKVVLTDFGSASSLIFDEIDRGAGGAVANAIGRRLSQLSNKIQLLSVTHAPQVAAQADHHFLISKSMIGDSDMVTHVRQIFGEERREEIARMLAGAAITQEARAAADQLIIQAM